MREMKNESVLGCHLSTMWEQYSIFEKDPTGTNSATTAPLSVFGKATCTSQN